MSRREGRFARALALAVAAALPLATWPGLETPFSTPKLWLLAFGVVTCGAVGWRSWSRQQADPRETPLFTVVLPFWLASWALSALAGDVVSLAALWLGVGAGLWALVLLRIVGDPVAVMAAQVAGATGVALVAVLQWAGHDPFVSLGWIPAIAGASPRLAVYGTLGNPNFVGCLMAGSLPLAAGLLVAPSRPLVRILVIATVALQAAALSATGSRAGALGLAAGASVAAIVGRAARLRTVVIVGLVLAAALVLTSTARPLADTVSGRLYIWRVTWPHAFDRFLTGQGPGAFEVRYPGWEQVARPAGPARGPDATFAGSQQNAHNDYLETLVERGTVGVLALVSTVLAGLGVASAVARDAPGAGATIAGAASLAALSAAAFVDFPLARPAEAVNFWTAIAIIAMGRPRGADWHARLAGRERCNTTVRS